MESKNGKNNFLAYKGFDLCTLPYTKDDIFAEPTQRRLQYTTQNYVPFLDYQNNTLDSLYSITQNSPTVSGIIAQKTAYTIAGGFLALPASENNPLPMVRTARREEISEAALFALNDQLKEINSKGQSALDLVEEIASNLWSFGNCFIEIIIIGRELSIRVLSTYLCRPKKADKNKLYPEKIGVSEEWQEFGSNDLAAKDYPIFPNFERIDGALRSIYHLKFESPNFYYWGRPDWLAAKIWGELEYRLAKYNQARFENGFTPSAIISAYGFTNSAEAQTFVDSMKGCFTSTGNNSKMFIQALRDEASKMDVQILNDQSEGSFLELAQLAREEIITGSRWKSSLAGLTTAGQLGSNQQIRAEFDIVYNTVIRPVQKKIMRALNAIFAKAEALGVEGFSSSISLDLTKAMPVTFAGDIKPEEVLTINELREELGRGPLESGDIINTKTGANGDTN